MYSRFLKPFFDILIASIALLLLSPIFIIITICLWFLNDKAPFFTQKRPGKDEKIFSILKFKTMDNKTDASGNLLPDSERLTVVGRIIRKTSLDELPQLINIIRGEMSFIGPRPLLVRYLPYYTETEKKRHSIKPGITGLAQVSGRNMLNWDDRLAMDVEYQKHMSFMLDLKIGIKTVKNVLTSKDIAVDPNTVIKDLDEIRSKH
jgi:lipopolysaccharide/colanic/teichoic acid biosynthesis glycosyltransferase